MKQVTNTKNVSVLSSSLPHSINPLKLGFILLLTCITLFISSCEKDDHQCKKTVPLKGEFVTIVTIIVPPSPGVLEEVRITGTGSGTPFGKATLEDNVKVDMSVSPKIISGTATITAENGDQIFSTISGYSPAPDASGKFPGI